MTTAISIDLKLTQSFKNKASKKVWEDIISGSLDLLTLEAEKQCKIECPVDTGNLRRGHTSDIPYGFEKTIKNDVEYWPYVVYGTKHQPPNDYLSMVKLRLSDNKVFEQALEQNEKKFGVK